MNHITISGRLTADPVLRTVNTRQGELEVCNISIACNDYAQMKDQENKPIPQFFRFSLWRDQAVRAHQWLKKGSFVIAEGAVNLTTYTGNDGDTRASLELSSVRIDYSGTPRNSDGNAPAAAPAAAPVQQRQQPVANYDAPPAPAPAEPDTAYDLPF